MYYFSYVAVAAACCLRLRACKAVYSANLLAVGVEGAATAAAPASLDKIQPVEELVVMTVVDSWRER